MKSFAIALLSGILLLPTVWLTNLENAKQVAQQQHKLILVNFSGSDWCAPCIKMKKNYFDIPEFQQYAHEKLVLLKADFPRLKKNAVSIAQQKENEQLAEKYNPKGTFPCTVLLNEQGKVLRRWEGYPSENPSIFLQKIAELTHEHQ